MQVIGGMIIAFLWTGILIALGYALAGSSGGFWGLVCGFICAATLIPQRWIFDL